MASSKIPSIQVQKRDKLGSRYAARLRQGGRLPAVIYGHGQEPLHVSLDRKELVDLLHTRARLLEAQVDTQKQPVLVKEVQWDHLGTDLIHLDLTRVDLTEKVTVKVPLQFAGDAEGLKEEGAILERPVTELEVECVVTEIPDQIKVDVSALKVGDALTVKDIKLPEGVVSKLDPETVVATISIVQEEVVEVVPTAEGAAEPEIIGKKAGEEGAEGAAPAAEGGAKKEAAPKKEDKK